MSKKFGHVLSSVNVQCMCIKNDWFTKGTNSEYEEVLDLCGYVTVEDIEKIARLIVEHSEPVDYDTVLDALLWEVKTYITHSERGQMVTQ